MRAVFSDERLLILARLGPAHRVRLARARLAVGEDGHRAAAERLQ